jgi:hypothetical protein
MIPLAGKAVACNQIKQMLQIKRNVVDVASITAKRLTP